MFKVRMSTGVQFLLSVCLLVACVQSGAYPKSKRTCIENPGNKNAFKYILTNELKPPYFNYTAILVIEKDAPFDYYLRKAIDLCPQFTGMTASYYADLGWYITSLNGLSANNTEGTSWAIIDTYGAPSCLGVSSIIPQHKSVYTMNFTSTGPHA